MRGTALFGCGDTTSDPLDLIGCGDTTSTPLGLEADLERDLRYGRTFGTWR